MGHRNTLSGHIQEAWYVKGSDQAIVRLWEHNRLVLNSLPDDDNVEWPYLGKCMFSTSPMLTAISVDALKPTYRGPVIYFGGSFSSIYQEWSEWLVKFEDLLRHLYWEHAVVVLVTEWMGQHVCRWNAKLDTFDAEKPIPITEWAFEGGPRDFR
jgi:hypothetical protein